MSEKEKKSSYETVSRQGSFSCTRFEAGDGTMNYVVQRSLYRDGKWFNYSLNIYPRDIGEFMSVVQAMYDDFKDLPEAEVV